jgi:hypothetical protein
VREDGGIGVAKMEKACRARRKSRDEAHRAGPQFLFAVLDLEAGFLEGDPG